MKDIREVLHLYLGCEVLAPSPYNAKKLIQGFLTGIHGEYGPEIQFIIDGNAEESPEYVEYNLVKPVLSRLSDMTEEDANRFLHNKGFKTYNWVNVVKVWDHCIRYTFTYPSSSRKREDSVRFDSSSPNDMLWLIKNGYWIFGDEAFDQGLIIDAKTLKKNETNRYERANQSAR